MSHYAFNYVRTHRLRHALTKHELAPLIGQGSGTALAHFESGTRLPTLYGALALQVLFGQHPREMFPDFYDAVEEGVMRRAAALYRRLEGRTDNRSQAKRDFLDAIPSRGLPNDDIV